MEATENIQDATFVILVDFVQKMATITSVYYANLIVKQHDFTERLLGTITFLTN